MRKTWKKVLALVLALAMVIPGVYLGGSKAQEVQASEGDVVSTVTAKDHVESWPKAQAKEYLSVEKGKREVPFYQDGYLFAGLFNRKECTLDDGIANIDDIKGDSDDNVWAKFVPVGMLDVKAQSTPSDSGENIIRFVSSVDTLNYSQAGFEVTYTAKTTNDAGEPEEKVVTRTTTENKKVYKKIDSQNNNIKYEFDPKVVDVESDYFITAKLDITQEPFAGDGVTTETAFTAKAFWETLDGTRVRGTGRCVSIVDSRSDNIIVLSFASDNITTADSKSTLSPTLTADKLEIAGVEIVTVDPTTSPATVHARVTVEKKTADDESSCKENLPSATTFTFTKGGKAVSTIYRNLYTDYSKNGADTTWYTEYKKAGANEFIIATNADLYGFAQIVNATNANERFDFEQKTVYLAADIKANEGTASKDGWEAGTKGTSYEWTPIGKMISNTSSQGYPFRGILDGDGHTISGIYLNETTTDTNIGHSAGLFGYTVDCKIKNLRLENSYMKSAATVLGGIVGYGDGDLNNIYVNASLYSSQSQVGGIIGRVQDGTKSASEDNGNCTITNCQFDGTITLAIDGAAAITGGLAGYLVSGITKINNSIYTGDIICENAATQVAGLVGRTNKGTSKIYIKNSISEGTISGGNSPASVINNVGSSVTEIDKSVYYSAKYNLNVYTGINSGNVEKVNPSILEFTSADFLDEVKGILNENVVVNNRNAENVIWDTWKEYNGQLMLESIEQVKAISVDSDTSWYSASEDTYILFDAADLYGFAQLAKSNNFAGKTIKLGSNIKVNYGSATDWQDKAPDNLWTTPIGTDSYKFAGTFDGNDKTISGIYMKKDVQYMGLFGITQEVTATQASTVKNLRLENSYFEYTGGDTTVGVMLGSIAGQGGGVFRNIYSDAILVSNGNQVGGLIGRANRKETSTYTVENCWFNGEIHMLGDAIYAGGIVGVVTQGTANISNCLNTGLISSELTGGINVGGICGIPMNAAVVNINNCLNAGPFEILGSSCVGAIMGRNGQSNNKKATVTLKNTYATGDSYQEYMVGTNGTGQFGADNEEAKYIADIGTLVTYLNAGGDLWTVRMVNGIEVPVLSSLQDVLD